MEVTVIEGDLLDLVAQMAVNQLKSMFCFSCKNSIGKFDFGQNAFESVGLLVWMSSPIFRIGEKFFGWDSAEGYNSVSDFM